MKRPSTPIKKPEETLPAAKNAQSEDANDPTKRARAEIARMLEGKPTTKRRKEAMLKALVFTLGIVKTAAEMCGIERKTHYRWLDKDIRYKEEVQFIDDIALDFVESKAHQGIQKGDTALIIFYLKTKGKNRGYIERRELTGKDGEPLEPATRQIMIIGGKEVVF